jgi:hypothetical protein
MKSVATTRHLIWVSCFGLFLSTFISIPIPSALAAGGTPNYPGITGSSSVTINSISNAAIPDYTITDPGSVSFDSVTARVSTTAGTLTTTCASCSTFTGAGTTSLVLTGPTASVQTALNAMTLSGGAATVTTSIEPASEFTSGGTKYYFWNQNGHYYVYNATTRNQADHRNAAIATSFAGVNGYLVAVGGAGSSTTVASEKAENDFIGGASGILEDNGWPSALSSGQKCSNTPAAGATSCTPSYSGNYYWLPGGNAAASENAVAFKNTTVGSYPFHSGEPNGSGDAMGWSGWGSGSGSTGGNSATDKDEWDDWPATGTSSAIYEYGNSTTFTAASVSLTVSLDQTAPTITSFSSSTANGTYIGQQTINITATASENLTSGSTIVVTLDTGRTVTLTAASAGTSLSGTYTVQAGDSSADLTVSSFTVGTATDTAGNVITSTTLPTGVNNIAGSKAIVVAAVLGAATISTADSTTATLRSLTVTWGAISNVTSYTLRLYSAADALLATITGLTLTTEVVNSSDYASIANATTYKVSIQAVGNGTTYGSSAESAKVSASTLPRFTPTITLSLPGGTSSTALNDTVTVTASLSQDGVVNFKSGATSIAGCSSVTSSSGSATCSWYPTSLGAASLIAVLTPTNTTDYGTATSSTFSPNVVNGTSSVDISLTASATVAYKGNSITITANLSRAGKVTFYWIGKKIPGCINKTGTTTATCTWKPASKGLFNVTATFTPTNTSYAPSNAALEVRVLQRSGLR